MKGWIINFAALALVAGWSLSFGKDKLHWAFQPIRNPTPPEVKGKDGVRNPIDRFILAKLEANGLKPAPRASKQTLKRRAHFAVTGLPPKPEEDGSESHAELVDRLLDSPSYGEHWGRHWLDVARYADNKGYVFFEEKSFPWAWTYRDYVIRSLNEDKPYDRFIIEQLAADQLDLKEDKTPLTALGFLTLGARFSGNIHDILDDRIDVTTRGLMGLTIGCARCHDHKYDPVPTADYYSLYGVFRSSVEPTLPPTYRPAPDTEERRAFDAEMEKRLKALEDFVAKTRKTIISTARTRTEEYLVAVHAKRHQPSTGNFMLLTDKGAINPYVIHRWENYLKDSRREEDKVWTAWHKFFDLTDEEFAEEAAAIHRELQKDKAVNAKVLDALGKKAPKTMKEVAKAYGSLFSKIDAEWKKVEGNATRLPNDADEQLRQVLYGKDSPPMIPRRFGWGFLALLPDRPDQGVYKKLIKAVEEWSMKGKGAPARAMTLVDAESLYEPVIFRRGNPHQRGEPVPRRLPEVLSGKSRKPFRKGSGRLELAQAIASANNPLTARVIVNRVWGWHFGKGLVDTPSDFGLRSRPPSHPELLDWLASDFVKGGWSLKKLHRRIMNSATWQMASAHHDERAMEIDPTNKLMWRFNRQRLTFEGLRDSLVAVTGQMDGKMGGPPLDMKTGFKNRRSIYGRINRLDVDVVQRSFDFPDPNITCVKREPTTVAPQALYLMNNSFTLESGKRILQRKDLPSDTNRRIEQLYRILFFRSPAEFEISLATKYLGDKPSAKQWENYTQGLLMTNEFTYVD